MSSIVIQLAVSPPKRLEICIYINVQRMVVSSIGQTIKLEAILRSADDLLLSRGIPPHTDGLEALFV
jgi:hypothetical protein